MPTVRQQPRDPRHRDHPRSADANRNSEANFSSSTGFTSVYYAKINAEGSLGPWLAGPSLHFGEYAFSCGWGIGTTTNAIIQLGGHSDTFGATQILTVTEAGLAPFWKVSFWSRAGDLTAQPVSQGNGQWTFFCPLAYAGVYLVSTLTPMPFISVPLYATGLTNGATYHVVLQAVNTSSASDGMQLGTLDDTALPAVALQSNRHWSSWTPIPSGYSIPLRIWDNSAGTNNLVRHMVEDSVNGEYQRWTSVFYGQNKLLAGLAETTMHPNLALNQNPTFTSGTSPWTAVNGTITQTSAQTHGGFPFSGLLTPTGGFATAFASSELFPVHQSNFGFAGWVQPTGFFYTPTTWTSFSLSINWFDSGQNYISTSSSAPQTLTGATWTQASNFFQPPAGAAFASIVPTMSGSPGAANRLYMSSVFLTLSPETVGELCSMATVNYQAGELWPPVSITQLN